MKKTNDSRAGSEEQYGPRLAGEILHDYLENSNEPLAVAYREQSSETDGQGWHRNTDLAVDLKTILHSDTCMKTGKGYRGVLCRDQDADIEEFLAKLDEYILRLESCKGQFVVKPLNKIADQLAEEMARLADLADDDMLFELSHRSIFAAWKKGATLWILNNQTWSRSIGEYVIWFCYYDLWSKVRVFGDMFKAGDAEQDETQKRGPKNYLDELPNPFNETQLEAIRISHGKSKEGTKHQLDVWKNRGFITYSNQTGMYTKTEEYLNGIKTTD